MLIAVLAMAALVAAYFLLVRQGKVAQPPVEPMAQTLPAPDPEPDFGPLPETAPVPEPERVAAPEPQPEPIPPPEPEPGPPPNATIFEKAHLPEDWYDWYRPEMGNVELVNYEERANLQREAGSFKFALVWPENHVTYPGDVFHWVGRGEVFLPLSNGPAYLADVVGGRVYSIPEGKYYMEDGKAYIDRDARYEETRMRCIPLVGAGVTHQHLLYCAIERPRREPLAFGFLYAGVPLPVRAAY